MRTGKKCYTRPEKNWKLRSPLLVKTSVHPQSRILQVGSEKKKSASQAWDSLV